MDVTEISEVQIAPFQIHQWMARIQSMQNYSKQYSDPKYFSPEQTELYGEMSQTIYHEKQVLLASLVIIFKHCCVYISLFGYHVF